MEQKTAAQAARSKDGLDPPILIKGGK